MILLCQLALCPISLLIFQVRRTVYCDQISRLINEGILQEDDQLEKSCSLSPVSITRAEANEELNEYRLYWDPLDIPDGYRGADYLEFEARGIESGNSYQELLRLSVSGVSGGAAANCRTSSRRRLGIPRSSVPGRPGLFRLGRMGWV